MQSRDEQKAKQSVAIEEDWRSRGDVDGQRIRVRERRKVDEREVPCRGWSGMMMNDTCVERFV